MDEDAYQRHASELTRFATGLVGPDAAQDVVTDGLLRVMASDAWEEAANQRSLMYRAVFFESQSWLRSEARRRRRERRFGSAPLAFEVPDVAPEVLAAVAELSVQQRAVIYLSYWEDRSISEIAELLEISDGAVRKQLARARARLREVLA